ncbi:MAG: hypothetical protein Q9180_005866 [Flavoplaca navasiana]
MSHLPKKDLKSARLVSRTWASLGGQQLIGELYISPREIDMVAFDGITQHPDLSKSVKRLVYDSAQFFKFDSAAAYYVELCVAQEHGSHLHLGNAHAAIEKFKALIHPTQTDPSQPSAAHVHSENCQCLIQLKANICHEAFVEGYLQYSLHAQERSNIFRPSWVNRVLSGLNSVGFIKAVIIRNTWNDIYEGEGEYLLCKDISPLFDHRNHTDYDFLRSCIVPINPDDDILNHLVKSGVIRSDGGRSVGSPSARAYVPCGLQPLTPKPLGTTPDTMRLIEKGLSDGRSELLKLAALVHAADLNPLRLDAINDVETMSGLPPSTFEAMRSGHAGPLAALTENLKVLRLEIVAYARDSVTKMSLGLPFQYITQTPRYRLDQIFKPFVQGIRPTLRKLHIMSISASYNDLSRLLFLSLPNLKHLNLTQVLLLNGKWEDVVEGLRQIVPLTSGDLVRCFQSDQTPYGLDSNSTAEEFTAANSRYIVEGGIHPCAPAYVPSYELRESIKSWKQLRGKFEGAQNIEGDAPNPWSTELPLRNA